MCHHRDQNRVSVILIALNRTRTGTIVPLDHKVHILGLSHPLSRQRVCPSHRYQMGGGHTRLQVRGWGSPSSDDWRKKLSTLPALCFRPCTPFQQAEFASLPPLGGGEGGLPPQRTSSFGSLVSLASRGQLMDMARDLVRGDQGAVDVTKVALVVTRHTERPTR